MSRTERKRIEWDENLEAYMNREGRDDKRCRNPWCCGNGWQKAENKRERRYAKRDIEERRDV